MKLPGFITKFWTWFKTPSGLAIGAVLTIGFIAGIIFWGGFNTGMEMTNREEFCIGCHEMRENVYQEYVGTIHYTNRSGVRATCPDCHVPKEWGPKMIRKIQASKELYAKAFGKVDTAQKFEDHRLEMATREWNRMKPTIHRNAVTATTLNTWTLVCRNLWRPMCTIRQKKPGRLVSTVIRGLRTSFRVTTTHQKNITSKNRKGQQNCRPFLH